MRIFFLAHSADTDMDDRQLNARESKIGYRREIDGLRAVAVIPVLLFHAGFESFSGGFVGVDVFFVISGYLITSVIRTEMRDATFSLVGFYERRARRILPALFVVIAATLPAACYWLRPSELKDFSQSIATVAVFCSNVLFFLRSGYFDAAATSYPMLHTWSLAVEEQFYLLFPLLLVVTHRSKNRRVFEPLVIVALVSFALSVVDSPRSPAAAFFLLPSRAWELLLGALLVSRQPPLQTEAASDCDTAVPGQIAAALGLMMICVAVLLFDRQTVLPGFAALLPTVGAAMVIWWATPKTVVGRVLGSPLLVGIGLISYSAYLWHWPLFVFWRRLHASQSGDLQILGLCLATLALAGVTYHFVESPFRRRAWIGRRHVFMFAGAGSAAMFAFGAVGYSTEGFLRLKTTPAQRELMATAVGSPAREECHTGGAEFRRPSAACHYFHGAVTWAVLGDSHAVELAWSLAGFLRDRDVALRHYSFSACAPSFGRPGAFCEKWTTAVMAAIAADTMIKNVVVAYAIVSHLRAGTRISQDDTRREQEEVWQSYVAILRALRNANKNVFMVLQAPDLPGRVEDLVYSSGSTSTVRGSSKADWVTRSTFVRRRIREVPVGVILIDPVTRLCDDVYCYAARARKALYFDDNHLSVDGAALVATEILQRYDALR